MQLTMNQIQTVIPGLQQIAQIKMTLKQAYDIGRVLRMVGVEFEEYHKLRDAKVKELGNLQENGTYMPKEGEAENVTAQIKELGEVLVEVDTERLKFSLLEKIEASWQKANPTAEVTLFTPAMLASINDILDV